MSLQVFGLTGGIASGKSSVAAQLRERGVPMVDADELARRAVEPGSSGLAEIVSAFGPSILLPDGSLDRRQLGARVFGDESARKRLNAIVHPRVRELSQQRFAALDEAGVKLAGYDVPLLFEVGLEQALRPVVLVATSEESQLERLMQRDSIGPDEARARIAAQWPLDDKRARADYVIENDGSLAELAAQVDELLRSLRAGSARAG
ncbi:MAG TPA: dephospho-CoA kinase [Polyangiaceae bacterium]